jgi:hypothetical protein
VPFSQIVTTGILLRAKYVCEACHTPVFWVQGVDLPLAEAHSATGLHLVQSIERPDRYVSTWAAPNQRGIVARSLPARALIVWSMDRKDDGFCLCFECHDKLHRIARKVAGAAGGNNSLPLKLEELTVKFCLSGGRMTL